MLKVVKPPFDGSGRGHSVKLLGAVKIGVYELPEAVGVCGVGEQRLPLDWRDEVGGGLHSIGKIGRACRL